MAISAPLVVVLVLTWISIWAAAAILVIYRERMSRLAHVAGDRSEQTGRLGPPISVVVPAFNEVVVVRRTLQSLLNLNYSNYEVVLVNDGSEDGTLDLLTALLDLSVVHGSKLSSELRWSGCREFRSERYSQVRVVDRPNGGKAEALNTGIALSDFPWFCCVDADTVMEPDCLNYLVDEIADSPAVIAVAGHVRVGGAVSGPLGGLLVRSQAVEYARSFAVERATLSVMNGLIIVPGALGLFNRRVVCQAGGYHRTSAEDLELILRLRKRSADLYLGHRIAYTRKALAWTDAPSNLRDLTSQRRRWYRGLWSQILFYRRMLFRPRYGIVGVFVLPYLVLFELLGPVLAVVVVSIGMARSSSERRFLELMAFLIVAKIALRWVRSVSSLLIDRFIFKNRDTRIHNVIRAAYYSLIEGSGYALLLYIIKISAYFSSAPWAGPTASTWQTFPRGSVNDLECGDIRGGESGAA